MLKSIKRLIKKIYIKLKFLYRFDMVKIAPFCKVNAKLGGIKSVFITHMGDMIHGGMIRGDIKDKQSQAEIDTKT